MACVFAVRVQGLPSFTRVAVQGWTGAGK